MSDAYGKLLERIKDVSRLGNIGQLLDWDQETYMPKGGVTARAEQAALIAGLAHEKLVADETRTLLENAAARDDDYVAQTNIREARRMYNRAAKLPADLVKEIARTSSLSKDAWAKARAESNFPLFAPLLSRMIDLKKQVAEHIGYTTEPYDALMDEFEPGAKCLEIEALFTPLRKATVDLLRRVSASSHKPDASILTRHYPKVQQESISRRMAESLNFDFNAGRADVSVHPFCSTIGGGGDVRITTRFMEDFLPAAMFGTMHEVGHALYEQGLLAEHSATPMADAVSMGIHESQSRMWENMVGRSRAFWTYHYSHVKAMFPASLGDVSLDAFYGAINTVMPSLIRVEADELTYNLHIILRFELERALFTGKLGVGELPAAWNDKMKSMLGISPPNDALGCLQDIHWSMGAFGYFPTYTLGNLYAAQFYEKAVSEIPELPELIAKNNHRPLLNWLRDRIHRHGKRYSASHLVQIVTGRALSIDPFVRYVTEKFLQIYHL